MSSNPGQEFNNLVNQLRSQNMPITQEEFSDAQEFGAKVQGADKKPEAKSQFIDWDEHTPPVKY